MEELDSVHLGLTGDLPPNAAVGNRPISLTTPLCGTLLKTQVAQQQGLCDPPALPPPTLSLPKTGFRNQNSLPQTSHET
jgi:hypothetical protein